MGIVFPVTSIKDKSMGGGSGSFSTTIDVNKLINAANQRIKDAFEANRDVLFCCSSADEELLTGKIARTSSLAQISWDVITESTGDWHDKLERHTLLIVFIADEHDHRFINSAIRVATDQRKIILFTPHSPESPVPQYVTQLRIRAMTWQEIGELLS